jgi:hypothetical protein
MLTNVFSESLPEDDPEALEEIKSKISRVLAAISAQGPAGSHQGKRKVVITVY